jgi:uncharacterized membrane protein YhaH (DUF805 family)
MDWMLMPLRRYAEFSGRSRRKEYWMFWLLNMLIGLFVGLVFLVGYYADMSQTEMDTWLMPVVYVAGLWSLATLIPGLAVTIRRLHDTDRSGWSILFGLIPLIGGLILLYFYLQDGTEGPNRFGTDPKGGVPEQVFA